LASIISGESELTREGVGREHEKGKKSPKKRLRISIHSG